MDPIVYCYGDDSEYVILVLPSGHYISNTKDIGEHYGKYASMHRLMERIEFRLNQFHQRRKMKAPRNVLESMLHVLKSGAFDVPEARLDSLQIPEQLCLLDAIEEEIEDYLSLSSAA